MKPVTVVRDRWGMPHITASSADDLFFAQGFVQAQDRLFQMDLWRRSVQGRLSEVLGANFVDRDAMTRRIQFRGNLEHEWGSYAADAREIAAAFTRGINAWVDQTRTDLPEEFSVAGWRPEYWRPEDLLNRTDAYVASVGADDELLRARLVAKMGRAAVDRLLPLPDGRTTAATDVDLSAINFVVGDVLRRIGTPPFFTGLAAPPSTAPRPGQASGSNAWVIAGTRTATGLPLLAVDPHRPLDIPSLRYLVDLSAPGWHAAGATAPWLPGVAIGHNDRVAWGMTSWPADTQDIIVERLNPSDSRQVQHGGRWTDMSIDYERVAVLGRAEPFQYERRYTTNGAVVAVDNDRHLAYVLRWDGTDYGGAAELSALTLDRAASAHEFGDALSRWKMPPSEFVYADVDGQVARQRAGFPLSHRDHADIPRAGWTNVADHVDPITRTAEQRDSSAAVVSRDTSGGVLVAANGDRTRSSRLMDVLVDTSRASIDDMKQLQLDLLARRAERLIPLVQRARDLPPEVLPLLKQLQDWDRRVTAGSEESRLYVRWEAALARSLAAGRVPAEFVTDVASRIDAAAICEQPTAAWFDNPVAQSRDRLLVAALVQAGSAPTTPVAGEPRDRLTFAHPLGVFEDARRRFNVGPFPLPGYPHTVFATDGRNGPAFRAIFDLANWDRSVVISAPGESGAPASSHYEDLARLWARGEYVPLAFSAEAVKAGASETLTLLPR